MALKTILSKVTVGRFLIAGFLFLSAYLVASRHSVNTRFPLQMDANGYYIYLPAIFIYNDLEKLSFVDKMPEQFDRIYFLYPGVNGGYMTKYTPGMAILELPFFAAAHFIAPVLHYEQSGYSPPYRLAIAVSCVFYTCLGLWILSLVLARYFKKETVLATTILLFAGTNLFHYAVLQPALTHSYVFFVLCLLLFYIDRWFTKGHWEDFAWACACVGFCTLIRPTEVLVGFIPLGMLFQRWKSEGFSWNWLLKQLPALLGGVAGFLVFIAPVFMYWKFATGNWVAYTYEQEGFYFDRPWQIWLGLFGSRKGWFIYTPMLFLSLWGMLYLWRQVRFSGFRAALLWYMPINLYIVLSWYGWWYGGCFGLRALVPALALMAIPLALLLEEAKRFRILVYTLAVFFTVLNIFQSFQYQRRIMHMDAMTWKAYFYIFGKWELTREEEAKRNAMLDYPDYNQRGKKLDEYFK